MKKINTYNTIYDEIVREVENGKIEVGINRDFDNYQFRIENIKNGNFTKDDLIALFINIKFGNETVAEFVQDKLDEMLDKQKRNEKLEKDDIKFLLEAKETSKMASSICDGILWHDLDKIPELFRSPDVIINSITFRNAFEYLKTYICLYNRQFFKDLIATKFFLINDKENNLFSIMPLEYIDEEMCLLAVLNDSLKHGHWFTEVYKRKPEVLTERLWKLAARFYVFNVQEAIDFMKVMPKEYKDYEFYQELCSYGSTLFGAKKNMTDVIPSEILTPQFLLDLILKQSNNVSSFSEKALNTELSYKKYQYVLSENSLKEITVTQKAWQMALLDNAQNIWFVKPDEEKLTFFLRYYPAGTEEYNKYIVGEENLPEEKSERNSEKSNSVSDIMFNAFGNILKECCGIGRLPRKYIQESFENEIKLGTNIFEMHDMLQLYEIMGITFDANYDTVGPNNYLAILPEGWEIIEHGRKLKIHQFLKRHKKLFTLNNENGDIVLEFSRTSGDKYDHCLVEKINFDKVEEAYKKWNDSEGFNRH